MSTDIARNLRTRSGLPWQSDLTDADWALLKPVLPPASHEGRRCKWPMQRIVEVILYLLRSGLEWQMMLTCSPPVSNVRRWFYLWRDNRLRLAINHSVLIAVRKAGGPQGYDAAKKIKGHMRHILTDS